jgi:GNAT superfamily N-acetyltransferase
MNITVEAVAPYNLTEAKDYLKSREETSQFLINNLLTFGYTLTDHPNSGNYKLIREGGAVKGVFCLFRRGNLIAQTEKNFCELILGACKEESVALKGFIGGWETMGPIWERVHEANPTFVPTYNSKEILYRYMLAKDDPKLVHGTLVRAVTEHDFEHWYEMSKLYYTELGLPLQEIGDKEHERKEFALRARGNIYWGMFHGNKLISRAALNSKTDGVGQVGAVFTLPEFRKKGLSKRTMFHMLKDCRDLHGHKKSILFTGQVDHPAQALYESMGYERIGHFALILA